jgi:hypothetical protein
VRSGGIELPQYYSHQNLNLADLELADIAEARRYAAEA